MILGEDAADFRRGPISIVGCGFNNDGHAARCIAFVDNFFKILRLAPFAGPALDRALDVIVRHALRARGLNGAAQTRIAARIAAASTLLAAVSWVVWRLLYGLLGLSTVAQIVSVGAAAACGLFVYARAVIAMHVPEAHQVHRLILTQLGRA